ncbi:MAG: aminotransferase class IV [Rhodospirillales bacterium]
MSVGVGLIESIFASVGGAPRLQRHLERLFASAGELGIPCDKHVIEVRAMEALRNVYGPSKVRLVLQPDGALTIDTVPLSPLPEAPTAIVANVRLPADDPLLRHKTTRRKIYDLERARLGGVENGFDVIFLNDRDEVAEGAISNVFARFGSELVTPPLDCGLLPGVMRAELLADHGAQERILTLDNLRAADAVILTNAVRGLVPVSVDFDYRD